MAAEINFDGYAIVNTGGISLPVTTILSTGQPILVDSCVVLVTEDTIDASGIITSTLPSPSSSLGKVLIIKNSHPTLAYEVIGFGNVPSNSVVYIISDGTTWLDITP